MHPRRDNDRTAAAAAAVSAVMSRIAQREMKRPCLIYKISPTRTMIASKPITDSKTAFKIYYTCCNGAATACHYQPSRYCG